MFTFKPTVYYLFTLNSAVNHCLHWNQQYTIAYLKTSSTSLFTLKPAVYHVYIEISSKFWNKQYIIVYLETSGIPLYTLRPALNHCLFWNQQYIIVYLETSGISFYTLRPAAVNHCLPWNQQYTIYPESCILSTLNCCKESHSKTCTNTVLTLKMWTRNTISQYFVLLIFYLQKQQHWQKNTYYFKWNNSLHTAQIFCFTFILHKSISFLSI